MSPTTTGIAVGAVLAIVGLVFGFWGFLLTAVLMALGALIGRAVTGKLDVAGVVDALRGKRTSA
ncbi:DUF2273 domain-containing protein [Tersicoccus sp. Bi-70]|uniref:DUF2273 domain-containing protein n=1 Tax=Tersicoccus sp. Bi-70 TaxID=1897634 RepID=UPI000976D86F|nr:DUF2273 domain-containing protein [Tersicoccus sp. Bi-70]OMH34082.1 hypothetical protein BGP79_02630 [Tersicoccus sp. Bi-70]